MKNWLTATLFISILASLELAADFSLTDPAAALEEWDQETLTVILAGGTVYNGDEKKGRVADVGILDHHIMAIGNLSKHKAKIRLDVSGLAVTPGFIDIHSHAVRKKREESGIFLWPDAENYIRQGVTTVIGGPDGFSEYPVSVLFADLEDAPASVNFGTFVGHNTIRELAMGRENRAPTVQELRFMKDMVKIAMVDGAFGLSSGLKYVPGAYSKTEEVIALARVAGLNGGIYITHMREEGLGLIESVAETIRIGEKAGLPAQITHHKAMGMKMWGKSSEMLEMVNAANARGLDITLDQYPYSASSAVNHGMSEEDVVRIMQYPKTMIASDGGIFMPGDNVPHPRNYGSFARVLGVYVREKGVLSFPVAVHKMSRMPADRIGLQDRGRIEVGAIADITVLDPNRVIDRATYQNPHQFSEGVQHVFVNGQAVLLDGKMTGERPGRVLRSNRD
ncbi:amidohydrolase family protein [Pseudomonadota bacterium]